ncbi:hypothetical protein EVAR_641_1 [Eumeta japonica]|uniref:Uncharacterized protein n=1 Tax=Eumeta variegata TaxID=151549 RepID=A0A4C1SBH0_EUMVA|nr:hypothetical protein EVAR_641_1 [Eumeta japonica]
MKGMNPARGPCSAHRVRRQRSALNPGTTCGVRNNKPPVATRLPNFHGVAHEQVSHQELDNHRRPWALATPEESPVCCRRIVLGGNRIFNGEGRIGRFMERGEGSGAPELSFSRRNE